MGLMRQALPRLLSALADRWPSPKAHEVERIGAEPGTDEYALGYALDQFGRKVSRGCSYGVLVPSLMGARVLEIGCGHGGISCYLACIGAREVVSIDVNEQSLAVAARLKDQMETRLGRKLAVEYRQMDAHALEFEPASFDVVYADNLFEHVSDPEAVLRDSFRVLRDGGMLLAPAFSSIHSKWGLHLKWGMRVPWLNAAFSEQTIVDALRLRAARDPSLFDVYPGLKGSPHRVRDVRRHRDLNDVTYRQFKAMAAGVGFDIEKFHVHATPAGRLLHRAPAAVGERALEYLSTSATAVLRKPKRG